MVKRTQFEDLRILLHAKRISGRADVDKAVTAIPEQLRGSEAAEQVSVFVINSGKKGSNLEKSNGNVEDSNEEHEAPTKKSKLAGKRTRSRNIYVTLTLHY